MEMVFVEYFPGTKNSEVIYALVSGEFSRNFTIDPKRGIIVPSTPLDYEELPISKGHKSSSVRPLRLTVRARDAGTPSLSSDAPLIIYLKDINDNAPAFERTLYKRSIPEDLGGGTSVVQVRTKKEVNYKNQNFHLNFYNPNLRNDFHFQFIITQKNCSMIGKNIITFEMIVLLIIITNDLIINTFV